MIGYFHRITGVYEILVYAVRLETPIMTDTSKLFFKVILSLHLDICDCLWGLDTKIQELGCNNSFISMLQKVLAGFQNGNY